MKRCPECRRDYVDDSLRYCLEDGVALVQGAVDEPPTAMLHSTDALGEDATKAEVHTTDKTAVLPSRSFAFGPSGFDRSILLGLPMVLMIGIAGFLGYRYVNPSAGQINSIAVLPFENRSGTADAEYLSDGLTDSLIYRLTQLPDLKVSPTSSVIRYKAKGTDVAEIARELEVDAVISGKLTQRGDNLSISVELIDARSKKLVWGEQYDRKMSELLNTQREIASTIAEKLQLRLAGNETGITKKYTNSNEAYQLYLKGRFHYAKRTKDDLGKAIDYFEQAVNIDPNFALAHAMIADAYVSMPAYPYGEPRDVLPKARAAAARALEIDPMLAEAHSAMGYALCFSDWNWADAERSFKRAIEIDPKNTLAHLRFGIYSLATGQAKQAVRETETAVQLEPLSLVNVANLTWVLMADGRIEDSLVQGKKTYDLEPNFILGRYQLGLAYNASGMYTEAIALAEKSLESDPENQLMLQVVGYAYARSGRPDDARKIVERLRKKRQSHYAISYFIATTYAGLGERETAFSELERAFEERDWRMSAHIKWDFMIEPLRGDPRYKSLLKRMNLPE